MRRAEVDLAMDWAAAEGWNPGIHDADCFHAADPDGFLLGLLEDEPIGGISVVAYDERFGFLGLYIVRPEYRGRGFGIALWNAGMARLGARNIGLDGVVEQQPNYRRAGFALAYRNERYEGVGGGMAPDGVVALSQVGFDGIAHYDARMFGVRRPAFLERWLAQPRSQARAVVTDGALSGYGMIRACRHGHKIGPLFADSPDLAEALYASLVAGVPGEPVFLDVPQANADAVALAQRHHMRPVFQTARMYRGGDPAIPVERVFGVTTFELG
ncbi:MAG: GNAT family N-acetyltransferase [Rhodospirillales bacterium]|nr:GNAT family N-acetyltransferase [Rhodospirillales bacterium]